MTAGTPLVKSICSAMGWEESRRADGYMEGGALPTSAPPPLFQALAQSLDAMARELEPVRGARDQGALRAAPTPASASWAPASVPTSLPALPSVPAYPVGAHLGG
eukprot:3752067-Rhodomonas_salina.1